MNKPNVSLLAIAALCGLSLSASNPKVDPVRRTRRVSIGPSPIMRRHAIGRLYPGYWPGDGVPVVNVTRQMRRAKERAQSK